MATERTKHVDAVADLRSLCRLGLPSRTLMPSLLEALRRIVPSLTSLFDWVDADGHIVDYYTEPPYVAQAAERYFAAFYNQRESELMPPYSERLRYGDGVLDNGGAEASFYRSDFYNEIWRPRGVQHSVQAVLRVGRVVLGALTLCRGRADSPFSARERQTLGLVLPYLSRSVATGAADDGPWVPTGETGLLLSDDRGRLLHASSQGRRLLYMARHPMTDSGPDLAAAERAALPDDLLERCLRLAAAGHAAIRPPPVHQRHNAWGRFVFRAHWMERFAVERALLAIEIERQLPMALQLAHAVQALPLSVRQRECCMLVARGFSYAVIGARMGVTTNTAISYARAAYDRLGIGGREDLVKHLFVPAPCA